MSRVKGMSNVKMHILGLPIYGIHWLWSYIWAVLRIAGNSTQSKVMWKDEPTKNI